MATIPYAKAMLEMRRQHGAELTEYVYDCMMEGRESLPRLRRIMSRYLGRYPTALEACKALAKAQKLDPPNAPYDAWLWRQAGTALNLEDGTWAVWRKI